MLSPSFLLTLLLVSAGFAGPLVIERLTNQTVTGRGLLGSMAAGVLATALRAWWLRRAGQERARQERLRLRGEAWRRIAGYSNDSAGEGYGGAILIALAVVAVALFILSEIARGGAL